MREKSYLENNESFASKSKEYSSLKPFWEILLRYKGMMFLSILSIITAAFVVLGMGNFIKNLLNNGIENLIELHAALMWVLGGAILLILSSLGRTYCLSWIGETLAKETRFKILSHLLKLDVGFFDTKQSGALLSQLNNDILLLQIFFSTSLGVGIRNFFLIIGGLVMMIITSPLLSFYCLAIIPAVTVCVIVLGRKVKSHSKKSQEAIAEMSGYAEEQFSHISTLFAFNQEPFALKEFSRHLNKTLNAALDVIKSKAKMTCSVMVIVFVGVTILLWAGGVEVLNGNMTVGELSVFIFYALNVVATSSTFSDIMADLQRGTGAAERVTDLLKTSSAVPVPSHPRSLPEPSRGIIAFHNVSFRYPHAQDRPVLNGITFSIHPGEKVALVGLSGAGKSTIFSLILRFYLPQSGNIHVDGIDMKDIDSYQLRERIGFVPQNPVMVTGTLYENLTFGSPYVSYEDVQKAVELAYLDEFIRTLPQGLDTPLGSKGVQLSGGQKQRIAIARAILRNPSILLLDEATNSLDAESENAIQQSLKLVSARRTTLIIAHRLTTVLQADKIIVVDKGTIQAVGTHAELIAQDGLYRRLVMLQFSDVLSMNKAKIS